MKRLALLFTAALIVFSFGLANAQDVATIAGPPAGSWTDGVNTYVNPGVPVVWTLHYTVATADVAAAAQGYEIYTNSDGSGTPDPSGSYGVPVLNTLPLNWAQWWDAGTYINLFSVNGSGADTIGLGGLAITKNGLPVGFDMDVATITTQANIADTGKYLCIDSAYYPPGGEWLWSTYASGNVYPAWGGPFCYQIAVQPDVCPNITNGPGSLTLDHCQTATYTFTANDPDNTPGGITFGKVSGPGTIDPNTGVWSWAPTLADVGNATLVVEAYDAHHAPGQCPATTVDLTITNQAPTITCKGAQAIGKGNTINVQITGDNVDCDPGTFSVVSVDQAPVGTYSIDPNTGMFTFNTDQSDCTGGLNGDGVFNFTIAYSDGNATATCTQEIDVLCTEPYAIVIQKAENVFQGGHAYVSVYDSLGSEDMWGFDLLIAYDNSALSFQSATPGSIYDACGWEYFTYRYGANGNCSGSCPSGLLRIVGLAETNNGAQHPSCFQAKGQSLATLDFLVTNDRTFACSYVPIRFYWMDCGDNTISYHQLADQANPYSQTLGVDRAIYDFSTGMDMANYSGTFPTYTGAPDDCMAGYKVTPERFVDFFNGGIDIICADSIDARGDINLDGQAYTIADVTLFTNYFVYGVGVFSHYQASAAASDVNADGIPLSVADLVYLTRVVIGDALPYPKTAPIAANVSYNGSVVSVDQQMGAAFVQIEGNVTPQLLANNMEMLYHYDAANNVTRCLVYSTQANQTFQGQFLNAEGNVKSIQMATYEGQPVAANAMPTEFKLNQNYPNPFNPTTTISFTLPQTSDYTVTIYNVAGQEVYRIAGRAEAGRVDRTIDLSGQASGVYLYRVDAGSFSAVKKMLLLK